MFYSYFLPLMSQYGRYSCTITASRAAPAFAPAQVARAAGAADGRGWSSRTPIRRPRAHSDALCLVLPQLVTPRTRKGQLRSRLGSYEEQLVHSSLRRRRVGSASVAARQLPALPPLAAARDPCTAAARTCCAYSAVAMPSATDARRVVGKNRPWSRPRGRRRWSALATSVGRRSRAPPREQLVRGRHKRGSCNEFTRSMGKSGSTATSGGVVIVLSTGPQERSHHVGRMAARP